MSSKPVLLSLGLGPPQFSLGIFRPVFLDKRPFYGEEILPNAQSLLAHLGKHGRSVVYSVVESDEAYGRHEYAQALIEVSQ